VRPVTITNTLSVGTVRDAVIEWAQAEYDDFLWALPVTAETWDGGLNDIDGFHVRRSMCSGARLQKFGGRGQRGWRHRDGLSRVQAGSAPLHEAAGQAGGFTVGVWWCNYGVRSQLTISGVPVGRISDLMPCYTLPPSGSPSRDYPLCGT
jgi:L-aminopeptidase/D-esterase-like protein